MTSNSSRLRVGILIISDTAHADPHTDKSLSLLGQTFTNHTSDTWETSARAIVPDDIAQIQQKIKEWCQQEEFMNLIVTSGGTGFAVKDVTPEAVGPLIEKHAPGLVHAMLATSLEITPFAMMSRPVVGVCKRSLIVTLPGSPKGAKENLEAILKLLPHACLQAAGGDSRFMHAGGVKKLEEEAGVSGTSKPFIEERHHHSHDHPHAHQEHSHGHGAHAIPKAHTALEDRPVSNDPRAGPTRRHRESPFPKIPVEVAIKLILANTPEPRITIAKVDTSLIGSILAEDVQAREPVPAFRASIVDGYAIIVEKESKSPKGVFPISSISHAKPSEIPPLQPNQIVRITTGAPLPLGATAVVMVEDTILKSTTLDGKEESEVEILTDAVNPGENIREIGSDIKTGEVVLRRGEEITAVGGELGLLASVGRAEVKVYQKPKIGVISTGDEIVEHDRPGELRLGEVRDCNRPTLLAAIRGWGFEPVDLSITPDTPGALESSLRDAFRKVDVIISSGGVSMGELDLLKPTIERSLGGTIHFGRVAMKPGMPTTFATVPIKDVSGTPTTRLIFSLPGNPASALVTAHLFALPSLRKSCGAVDGKGMNEVQVILDQDLMCDKGREEYQRVMLSVGNNAMLLARSTGGQRSSRIASVARANGLVRLPAGGGMIRKGQKVQGYLMGKIGV